MDGRQRPAAAAADPDGGPGPGDPSGSPLLARFADGTPWSHTDAMVAVGAGLLDLVAYLLFSQVNSSVGISVPGFLVLLLSGLPLLARRRYPAQALAAVLVMETLVNVLAPMGSRFGAVITVAVYTVARHCSGRVTAVAGVVTAVTTMLSQGHFGVPSGEQFIAATASTALVTAGGLAISRWQREVAANRQLLADRAVAEERRRIARELHDIVAHHITTMQLMAGGARANLNNPDVVRDALVTLESSGRLALREMRQLLNVLRAGDEPDAAPPSPQPGAEDLDRLVEESRRAGLPTDLVVDGPAQPLPPTVGLTVFRIVQEGLTNARKYAGPARATVRLGYRPDGITVEVRDDGTGPASPDAGPAAGERGGYGLIGMRERVALHGGTLETGPRPEGGFAVLAELPLAADETAEAAVQHGKVPR
ncbi:Signal transduction histidine kinase [Streptomyces sp. TLI_053]|uniref:sensor histidine kinase n=1 Tax=Streptomyces sp. TLI_053 TaxID=1855352 RepID=UPI00087C4BF1|nr:sensor histidine kinase [Streptomyces sp. TLI_053]SDT69141.1 Signal transduction histidine kinase [Streptomyces sp. TLI_053]